ncbi:hypothetical protein BDY19DRAFT_988333 [Irpex rosettiformis]|uniref:Uncharacterized protein n=1 Tax=Irpex rosettiformis TaxID=378272 RepID=A0ACB8UJE4_9APHY|nr:hypothetical protein BDY19DRAFT_988333 [Irpex rosettiformis]
MNNEGTVRLNNHLQATDQAHALVWVDTKAGPDHEPIWTSVCKINGVEVGRGTGPLKHVARDVAARQALETLGVAV